MKVGRHQVFTAVHTPAILQDLLDPANHDTLKRWRGYVTSEVAATDYLFQTHGPRRDHPAGPAAAALGPGRRVKSARLAACGTGRESCSATARGAITEVSTWVRCGRTADVDVAMLFQREHRGRGPTGPWC